MARRAAMAMARRVKLSTPSVTSRSSIAGAGRNCQCRRWYILPSQLSHIAADYLANTGNNLAAEWANPCIYPLPDAEVNTHAIKSAKFAINGHNKEPAGTLPLRESGGRLIFVSSRSLFQPTRISEINSSQVSFATRAFTSKASQSTNQSKSETRKELSAFEDPFDTPTDVIPEKPVTFTEGASYSLIILAGLGVAGAAAYAVFKELIFQPKEYKVFNKALKRIQDDGQVRVRIGSPITGYGSESRNRAARQRIPNRTWVDQDGVEHVEVNFYIRGPHGAGKVFTEMFKDKENGEWKFMYLIVELTSPNRLQLILESYLPA